MSARRRKLPIELQGTRRPSRWQRIVHAPLQWLTFLVFGVGVFLVVGARWLILRFARFEPRREGAPHQFDVICISHVPWSHIWQRNHHTMTRLARRRKVVYVEDFATSYLHVFARWAPGSYRALFWRHPAVRIRHPLLMPGESRFAAVRSLNRWILATNLLWYEWRLDMRNTVYWFYYPAAVYVVERCRPSAVVYDIQDEYSAFVWAPRDISTRERELIRLADVMFAGTHALYRSKCEGSGKPAYFYPCGVEFEHFYAAAEDTELPLVEPPELQGIGRPRLFYMGLIDARIDGELLASVAEAEPSWQIVMAGPIDIGQFDARRLLDRYPNIHFLGSIKYQRLPQFLAHSDVCIMPWKVNELTRHINPTKALEYLSTGRPVVSIRLPDLEAFFGDVVALADTSAEFIKQCHRALAGELSTQCRRGLEMARSYSWEKVVREMEEHGARAIAARTQGQNVPKREGSKGQ